MALTRPQFSSRYLEPLALRDVKVPFAEPAARQNENKAIYYKQRKPLRLTPLKAQAGTKPQCVSKILHEEEYDFIFNNSRPDDPDFFPSKQHPHKVRHSLPNTKAVFPAAGVTHRQSWSKLASNKTRRKYVSFSLPPLENANQAQNLKEEIAEIISSVLREDVSCERNTQGEEVTRDDVHKLRAAVALDKRKLHAKLGNSDQYGRRKLRPSKLEPVGVVSNPTLRRSKVTEKVLSRKAAANKFPSPEVKNPSRSSSQAVTTDYISALEKARQALLGKLSSVTLTQKRQLPRRRVLYLPALAAPCSEDFAATMRRFQHGRRFVSSPVVLDHVIRNNVPHKETAKLLDAVLRPPSITHIT